MLLANLSDVECSNEQVPCNLAFVEF